MTRNRRRTSRSCSHTARSCTTPPGSSRGAAGDERFAERARARPTPRRDASATPQQARDGVAARGGARASGRESAETRRTPSRTRLTVEFEVRPRNGESTRTRRERHARERATHSRLAAPRRARRFRSPKGDLGNASAADAGASAAKRDRRRRAAGLRRSAPPDRSARACRDRVSHVSAAQTTCITPASSRVATGRGDEKTQAARDRNVPALFAALGAQSCVHADAFVRRVRREKRETTERVYAYEHDRLITHDQVTSLTRRSFGCRGTPSSANGEPRCDVLGVRRNPLPSRQVASA